MMQQPFLITESVHGNEVEGDPAFGGLAPVGIADHFLFQDGNTVAVIQRTHRRIVFTGSAADIQAVTDDNDLMIINRSGVTIRTEVKQIRLAGRATQGVRIINLREGDAIASVMAVPVSENEDETEGVVEGAAESVVEPVATSDAPVATENAPAEE